MHYGALGIAPIDVADDGGVLVREHDRERVRRILQY